MSNNFDKDGIEVVTDHKRTIETKFVLQWQRNHELVKSK